MINTGGSVTDFLATGVGVLGLSQCLLGGGGGGGGGGRGTEIGGTGGSGTEIGCAGRFEMETGGGDGDDGNESGPGQLI